MSFGSVIGVLHPETTSDAEQKIRRPGAEAIGFVVFLVEQVFNLAEQRQLFYSGYLPREGIVRGKIESHVARLGGITKRRRGSEIITAANDIGDKVNIEVFIKIIEGDFSPISRAAGKLAIGSVPVEIGVIGVYRERCKKLDTQVPLHAVEARPADIFGAKTTERIAGNRSTLDHVLHFSMKVRDSDFCSVSPDLLFQSRIQFPTFLGAEIRIAESGAAEA